MISQLTTSQNVPVVVGLNWSLGGEPKGLSAIKVGAKGQGYFSIGGLLGQTTDPAAIAHIPLVYLVGQLLAAEREMVAVIMSLSDGRYWGCQIKDQTPVLDSEVFFDSSQLALEWAAQMKRNQLVAEIYVEDDFIDAAVAMDTGLRPKTLARIETLGEDALASAPRVQAYRVVQTGYILGGAAAVACGVAGLLWYQGYAADQAALARAAETPVAAPMIDYAFDNAAFSEACLAATRGEWPGVPGWKQSEVGCAISSAPRPIGAVETAYIWKEYERGERYRTILGSSVTSARMAEYMFQFWPFDKQIVEGQILAGHELSLLPVQLEAEVVSAQDLDRQIENVFLAVLEKTETVQPATPMGQGATPLAQASDATAGIAQMQPVDVILNTGLPMAFELARALRGVDILSAVYADGKTTLRLEPRKSRLRLPEGVAPSDHMSAATEGVTQ